jgi:hypothetical protein
MVSSLTGPQSPLSKGRTGRGITSFPDDGVRERFRNFGLYFHFNAAGRPRGFHWIKSIGKAVPLHAMEALGEEVV